jgi:tRNA(Ile)-lysidine synthase
VPGSVPLPGTGLLISLEIVDKSETFGLSHSVYNEREMGCLDWNRLPGSKTLRSWHHGDRYQPIGAAGETKIKDLFQQARVPVWERDGWPVLEAGDRIAWSRRFGAAAWCAAGPESRIVLRVREVSN